ncbi:EAL domain-containing protein [Arenimonas sp. SCN 70-307]|uniref:bifunctional diguanylate cyclase/phosphodiesterase n=1 Tax=Arenimonas sp. SCN 70-307 TaxID=1660089 RepID=UPI000AE1855C|nr:EAL domain-containing protein [Arenimonas sp. SCN 70-307]
MALAARLLRELPWLLGTGLAYVALGVLAVALTRQPGNVASAWVASAMLLGVMCRRPHFPAAYLVLGFAGRLAVGALAGDPWSLMLSHAFASTLAVGLSVYVLRRWQVPVMGLPDVRALVLPVFLVGIAGPALGGVVPAVVHEALGTGEFRTVWFTWIVAAAFGAVLMLPPLLAATGDAWRRLQAGTGAWQLAAVALGTLLATALSVGYLSRPFLPATVSLLVAAFIFGRLGTSLLCSANLALMVGLRLYFDSNALAGADGGGIRSAALDSVAFNLYAALAAGIPLVVSVLAAQRRNAMRELFEEKQLAETTLGSIGDAVITVDPHSRITYLNRVAEDMTGWTSAEAVGRPIDDVMRLLDAESGSPGLAPLAIAMRDRRIVGLALNTLLVARDGRKLPIEDSAAPIIGMDGELVGGVMVFHDVSESRAMALRMSHLAQHDYLTDLPNRVLLQDRLSRALADLPQGRRGGLIFLDLDHFKIVNDTLGHEIGDLLLQAVARRLRENVREDDTVSRQGGDEFVILMPRLADPRDAAWVAEKLIEAVSEPYFVDGHELRVGVSIGISLFPEDGDEATLLMKRADAALYHAKEHGRGRYEYYTNAMSERAERRLELERRLRRAIREGELVPYYQPKVDAQSRWITGLEVLVRWQPTGQPMVPPGEFIPTAEECGLVGQIDAEMLRQACRQCRQWQLDGLLAVPVAVNLSLAQFDAESVLSLIRETLFETGLDPGYLSVEITETQAMRDTELTREVLAALRQMGVQVAMDDFGTGYSSIGNLQRFGFDAIKVDRSLVAPLPEGRKHMTIVRAVTGMARAFECKVVAEGVETEELARLAATAGCNELQGYLFSRPVPAADVPGLLRRGRLGPEVEAPGPGMK